MKRKVGESLKAFLQRVTDITAEYDEAWRQHIFDSISSQEACAQRFREPAPNEAPTAASGCGRIHPTHRRACLTQHIFCTRCGAWMSSNCRRMGDQCMRVPPYKQAKSLLRMLMCGLYPWKHLNWPDGTPGTVAFKLVRLDNFD